MHKIGPPLIASTNDVAISAGYSMRNGRGIPAARSIRRIVNS